MQVGQHDGCVAAVVARGGVGLLVARFVLLVDNDQLQVAEGQPQRRACAEHQGQRVGARLPLPQFGALGVGKLGVIHRHLRTEDAGQAACELRGEGNFGHEVEHLSARRQHLGDEVHVNLRFAAGRHAEEQAHGF